MKPKTASPALWLRRAKPVFAYSLDGNPGRVPKPSRALGGFPNPPALWLRRAKPVFAYSLDGNPGRVLLCTRHLPPALPPRASRGLAKPWLWLQASRPWAKPVFAYALDGL